MRVLALDTTSAPGSVALLDPHGQAHVSAPADPRPFGERLPGWLLDTLAHAGLSCSAIDLFVVGAGPGSLTGMRVGIATMQGLACATARPLVAVSALEARAQAALRHHAAHGCTRIAAWSDARRGEVFGQLFVARGDLTLDPLVPPHVGPALELVELFADAIAGETVVVAGDAAPGSEGLWTAGGARQIVTLGAEPLAGEMARLGVAAAAAGRATRPHAVRPIYVRRPDAVVARERAARAAAVDVSR